MSTDDRPAEEPSRPSPAQGGNPRAPQPKRPVPPKILRFAELKESDSRRRSRDRD